MKALLVLVALMPGGIAHTASLDIPYTGGKQVGSVDVRYADTTGPSMWFWSYAIAPDTINVGDVYSIRLYLKQWETNPQALCEQVGEFGVQILTSGTVSQRKDSAEVWTLAEAYPDTALLANSPAVPVADSGTPAIPHAPGYVLAADHSCEGRGYSTMPNWNRTLFVRTGGHVAKIGIESMQTRHQGILPSFAFILSVKFRYVVNDVDNLTGLTSHLRQPPRFKVEPRLGARVQHDLYNPLGIKLRREPGRYEPALPAPRAR